MRGEGELEGGRRSSGKGHGDDRGGNWPEVRLRYRGRGTRGVFEGLFVRLWFEDKVRREFGSLRRRGNRNRLGFYFLMGTFGSLGDWVDDLVVGDLLLIVLCKEEGCLSLLPWS